MWYMDLEKWKEHCESRVHACNELTCVPHSKLGGELQKGKWAMEAGHEGSLTKWQLTDINDVPLPRPYVEGCTKRIKTLTYTWTHPFNPVSSLLTIWLCVLLHCKASNTWRLISIDLWSLLSYFSVYLTVYITNYISVVRSYTITRAENKPKDCDTYFVYCISIWLRYNTSLKMAVGLSNLLHMSATIWYKQNRLSHQVKSTQLLICVTYYDRFLFNKNLIKQ